MSTVTSTEPAPSDRTTAVPGARACTVRVPASTSNLGSGFDCIGLAVDRWITVRGTLGGDNVAPLIQRAGTLTALDGPATEDLVWRGFVAACAFAGQDAPHGVSFTADSSIPVARGLGSSAASLVAGVVLADELLSLGCNARELIDIAAGIEGHPDNVAPSVRGGAVLCVRTGDKAYHVATIPVHRSLRFVFAIPDFEFRTSIARAALPDTLPFTTAVDAAARSAALVAGLASASSELLHAGLSDVLHVPFRRGHIRGYDAVTRAAVDAGAVGATLSGSGSTLVAVTTEQSADRVSSAMAAAWRGLGVHAATFVSGASTRGVEVESGSRSFIAPNQ